MRREKIYLNNHNNRKVIVEKFSFAEINTKLHSLAYELREKEQNISDYVPGIAYAVQRHRLLLNILNSIE